MVKRHYWEQLVESRWRLRPIVWLAGVRRAGKTFLAQGLRDVEYFDCELPRVRRQMADPQDFWDGLKGKRVVLDEVHRLDNPSELLKIAADHYPNIRVLATGSSALGATSKFGDTLTGRKTNLWLTPMNQADLRDFGQTDLRHRLVHGGLPPFFLADPLIESDFVEWVDSYWARDVQSLFRLERHGSFQKLAELLMVQSGGILEPTSLAGPCGISRTTVMNYVGVLEATFVVHLVRPYHRHRAREIVAAPRVYGFDTGFVCHYRGWTSLRPSDLGELWEHLVLNELHAAMQARDVQYWRDKQGHEIDFVLAPRGRPPMAIECKWSADQFDPANLKVFRRLHPAGENLVVAQDVDRPFGRTHGDLVVHYESLESLARRLLPGRVQGSGFGVQNAAEP